MYQGVALLMHIGKITKEKENIDETSYLTNYALTVLTPVLTTWLGNSSELFQSNPQLLHYCSLVLLDKCYHITKIVPLE